MKYFLGILFAFFFTFAQTSFAQKATEQEKQSGTGRYQEYQEEEEQKKEESQYRFESGCGSLFRPISYATFTNYPPFGWVERFEVYASAPRYEARGLAQKLLISLAKKAKLAIHEKSFKTYAEALRALDQGNVDLLLGTYFDGDPYSNKAYVFPAFTNNPFILVSLKGKMIPFNTWDDLKGKKVVLRKEEGLWPMIERIVPKEINFIQIAGARNAFKLLVNKEVDFILSSRYAVEAELERFKLVDFVDISSSFLREPKLFFAFYKDGECISKAKKVLEAEMQKATTDNQFMSFLFNETINEWKEKFKDEPSILIREGFEMDDEMASFFEDEEQDDSVAESRKRKILDLDVNVLINALTRPVSNGTKPSKENSEDTDTTTEEAQPGPEAQPTEVVPTLEEETENLD